MTARYVAYNTFNKLIRILCQERFSGQNRDLKRCSEVGKSGDCGNDRNRDGEGNQPVFHRNFVNHGALLWWQPQARDYEPILEKRLKRRAIFIFHSSHHPRHHQRIAVGAAPARAR
jgi:hypothetical protein